MSQFRVDSSFWALFPQCKIGVVILEGINNQVQPGSDQQVWLESELLKANQEARVFLTEEVLSQNQVIAVWRKAFMQFKSKKNVRSSIESLLKRVEKGREVGSINPLVDLYNIISLRYALPAGGEDLDQVVGLLNLKVTEGGDEFIALGEEERDDTLPGEICYVDEAGAVCRCWNWREGQRTMLTEQTKRSIVLFESIDPERHQVLQLAMNEFIGSVEHILGGRVINAVVIDHEHREV
jgi:DNA/RNA-binding domain of Phe-tRNA-synthetase-like protein